MLKTRIVALLAVLMLVIVPFVGVSAQDQTIVEIAAGNADFSTLVELVGAAGLAETLSGEGPFTVFAPTNEAFAKLPAEVVAYLGSHPEVLTAALTYHVVPGKVMAANVKPGSVKSVEGSPLSISAKGGKVEVNDANVVKTDIVADNGVIHVIDSVVMPK